MKRMLMSAVVLLCACAMTAMAAKFEGKVVYGVQTEGQTLDVTLHIKDQKSKISVAGVQGMNVHIVMDWGEEEAFMLMDDQQMAMRLPLGLASMTNDSQSESSVAPVKTGKTKKILGRECEQWTIKTEDNTVEIWTAKDLGSFTNLLGRGPMGLGANLPDLSSVAGIDNFFPMQILVTNTSGRLVMSLEARAVEPGKLDDSVVSVPSTYTIVDTPPAGQRIQGIR